MFTLNRTSTVRFSDLVPVAEVKANWQGGIGTVTPTTFGATDYEIFDVRATADRQLNDQLKKTDLRLMRVHCTGLLDRWVNPTTCNWDEASVFEALGNLDASWRTVLNLPMWPAWMRQDAHRLLCPSEYSHYARMCADLVELVSVKHERKVFCWELMHELDDRYRQAGKLGDLWKLYNTVALAIKRQVPGAKIGGIAFSAFEPELFETFLKNCKQHIDFVSWHETFEQFAVESDTRAMAATVSFRYRVKAIRALVKHYLPGRKVPLLVDGCTLRCLPLSATGKQNSHVGAVWLASVLKHLAEAGTDMVTVAPFKDELEGLFDEHNRPRPRATVLSWFQKYLVGDICPTVSTLPSIEAFAVRNHQGRRALLLLNKSDNPVKVRLANLGERGKDTVALVVDAGGLQQAVVTRTASCRELLALTPMSANLLLL